MRPSSSPQYAQYAVGTRVCRVLEQLLLGERHLGPARLQQLAQRLSLLLLEPLLYHRGRALNLKQRRV